MCICDECPKFSLLDPVCPPSLPTHPSWTVGTCSASPPTQSPHLRGIGTEAAFTIGGLHHPIYVGGPPLPTHPPHPNKVDCGHIPHATVKNTEARLLHIKHTRNKKGGLHHPMCIRGPIPTHQSLMWAHAHPPPLQPNHPTKGGLG